MTGWHTVAETDGGLCKAQHHMSPQTVTMFIQSPTEFYFGGLEVFLGCCNPSRYVNRSAWLVACTDIRGCFLLWSKNPCSISSFATANFTIRAIGWKWCLHGIITSSDIRASFYIVYATHFHHGAVHIFTLPTTPTLETFAMENNWNVWKRKKCGSAETHMRCWYLPYGVTFSCTCRKITWKQTLFFKI